MTIDEKDAINQARGFVMAITCLIDSIATGMGASADKMALRGIEKLSDMVADDLAAIVGQAAGDAAEARP